jgi:hypothetical protein
MLRATSISDTLDDIVQFGISISPKKSASSVTSLKPNAFPKSHRPYCSYHKSHGHNTVDCKARSAKSNKDEKKSRLFQLQTRELKIASISPTFSTIYVLCQLL